MCFALRGFVRVSFRGFVSMWGLLWDDVGFVWGLGFESIYVDFLKALGL